MAPKPKALRSFKIYGVGVSAAKLNLAKFNTPEDFARGRLRPSRPHS